MIKMELPSVSVFTELSFLSACLITPTHSVLVNSCTTEKKIYISLRCLRNTFTLRGEEREKKAHVSHLMVINNNQPDLPSINWLHLCHYLPFPQWQNLIVISYFFLNHSHVQVITLRLEEIPASINSMLY